ncbi:MAG TPA: GAF domain-containing protein, partial [Candidatus Eisenbacteria bacterium]|nr:GAF domain-containing protein [Candidatus Eisenbacteria bacterium]
LGRGYRAAPRILGLLLIAIGGSVLFQFATGVNLGIDTLLMFDRDWGRGGVLSPGRMGPAGATSWTLLGIGFFLASSTRGTFARRFAPALPTITASIATLGLLGYFYGVSTLYSLPHTTVIAFQTATFIFAVSLGFIFSIPEHGPMLMLGDPHSGGVFARRMMPTIFLVPVLLGFLQITGERLGLHDSAFGSALRTVAEIIFFMLFVWIISSALSNHARRRAEVAEALRVSRQELRAELADSSHLQLVSTELIVEKNPERLYESILDAAVQLMRADFASIQMLYPARGELRLLAYRGFTPEAASFWTWVRAESECTCGMALRDGKRVIVSDTENSVAMNGTDHLTCYRQTGIRAVQSTPLLSRTGEIVGMISTHWRVPHEPLERELRLLDILARQAADLIERHRAEQEREALLESERA